MMRFVMPLYCCDWLRRMADSAGERGVAVTAFRDGDHRTFRLQARSLSADQMERWQEALRDPASALSRLCLRDQGQLEPILGVMGVPLRYCPHCGADLRRRITWHQREFDQLAEHHRVVAAD